MTRAGELEQNASRRALLREGIAASERQLDEDLRTFDELREQVRTADEASQELRGQFDAQDSRIREARRALETVRDEASHLEVQRATAESDLGHLASSCVDTVQATLDEVAAEVAEMEQDGLLASPKAVEDTPEPALDKSVRAFLATVEQTVEHLARKAEPRRKRAAGSRR